MLKIRLQRVGRKHEPSFRLVLTDSKNSTKSGRYLEILGNYDARHGDAAVFKDDRIKYWMSTGAQASITVHNLLVSKKIIDGKKKNPLPLKKAIIKESEAKVEEAPGTEAKAPAKEEPVEETKEKEEAFPEAAPDETVEAAA